MNVSTKADLQRWQAPDASPVSPKKLKDADKYTSMRRKTLRLDRESFLNYKEAPQFKPVFSQFGSNSDIENIIASEGLPRATVPNQFVDEAEEEATQPRKTSGQPSLSNYTNNEFKEIQIQNFGMPNISTVTRTIENSRGSSRETGTQNKINSQLSD